MTLPLTFAGPAAPTVPYDFLTFLISHWRQDEAAGAVRVDAHGSNDLTDNNTCGQVAGKINNAASYNLADSRFLSILDNASLSCGDNHFSWTTWLQFDALPGEQGVITRWGNPVATGYEFRIWQQGTGGGSRLKFTVKGGIAETTVTGDIGGAIATGVPVFVACVHNKDEDLIKISVNGGAFNTAAHVGGANDSGAALCFGVQDSAYMTGWTDSTSFWKGQALTLPEIQYLYNGGAGRDYPFA